MSATANVSGHTRLARTYLRADEYAPGTRFEGRMGSRGAEIDEPLAADATPADVAALYSWANLQGAKYRDYSASRREHRAKARYQAAKSLLEREMKAQTEAEIAVELAEREAFAAEAVARSKEERDSQGQRLELLRTAEAASRKAAAVRVEAARRAEAAARATMTALREEREIAEARASAVQQAHIYTEAERRKRIMAGPQPTLLLGEGGIVGSFRATELKLEDSSTEVFFPSPLEYRPSEGAEQQELSGPSGGPTEGEAAIMFPAHAPETQAASPIPAWLYSADLVESNRLRPIVPAGSLESALSDTLQDSREGFAARWPTLKGLLARGMPEFPSQIALQTGDTRVPLAVFFSLAGGVGKTSLAAALARALSIDGETVSLADVSAQRVLPFYFGYGELRPGMRRSVEVPANRTGRPIALSAWSVPAADQRLVRSLAEEIVRSAENSERVLLDMTYAEVDLLKQMAELHPTVLVPVLPDLNSVIGLQAAEDMFDKIVDRSGHSLLPHYVLNQFDVSLPLHLDVREVLRQKLGDRLLPYTVRRSPAVAEALAEGVTVLDYAPNSPVSGDYRDVAHWLKDLSPRPTVSLRNLRWSER